MAVAIKTIRIIKENGIRTFTRILKSYINRIHCLSYKKRMIRRKTRKRKRKRRKTRKRRRIIYLQKKKDADKHTRKNRSSGRLKREAGLPGC
jgi:hypothetical protein